MKFYGKQAAVLLLSLSLGAIALRSWQAANAVSLDDLLPQLAAGTSRSLDELTPETSSRPESLNQTDNPSGDRAVIGRDDRIPVLSNAYPWSAIGQVVSEVTEDAYSTCTGTLITRDVILTNAHCVVSPETGEFVRRVAFLPNLINGRIASEFDVAYGVEVLAGTDFRDAPTPPHPDDWALVVLSKPLGEKYGTIGFAEIDSAELASESFQEKLLMVGYSGDYPVENPGQTAGAHAGCTVLGEDNLEVVYHECDTFPGSSGGPVLAEIDEQFYIVALNSAEARDSFGEGVVNYAVKVPRMLRQIRAQLTN